MKKLLKFSLMLLAVTVIFTSCSSDDDDDNSVIAFNQLPQAAQSFVSQYVPNQTVTITKEAPVQNYITGAKYYVYLTGGYELDFDASGNLVKAALDLKTSALPASFVKLLPTATQTYLATNYPNIGVNEFEKQTISGTQRYKVELVNDVDLIFNANGQFVGIDQ